MKASEFLFSNFLYYSISAGRTVKLEMHLTLLGLAGCTGLVGTSLSGTSAHEFQWRSPRKKNHEFKSSAHIQVMKF